MKRIGSWVVIWVVIGAACSKTATEEKTSGDQRKRGPFPAGADTSGAELGDALARFKTTAIPESTDTIGMQPRPERVDGATGIHVVIAAPKDRRHEPLRVILAGQKVIEPVTTLIASSLAKPPTISINVVSCGSALAGNIDAECTVICYEALEYILHELPRFELTTAEFGSAFVSTVQGIVRHLIGDAIDTSLDRTGRDDHSDRTSQMLLAGSDQRGVGMLVASAYWLEELTYVILIRLMGHHRIDREEAWCAASVLEPKQFAGIPLKDPAGCDRQFAMHGSGTSAYLSALVTDRARARLKLREPPPVREPTCFEVGLAAQRIAGRNKPTLDDQWIRFVKDCETGKFAKPVIECAAKAKTLTALHACGLTIKAVE